MKQFVDIKKVFSCYEDRTLEQLQRIYLDNEYLKRLIAELIVKRLPLESISGKRILLKPNWVRHSIKEIDEICLRTHNSFLLATLEVVLSKNPAKVVVGDAPIQGCNWDKILDSKFVSQIEGLGRKYGVSVCIQDFRRATFDPLKNNPKKIQDSYGNYLIFDLGNGSLLEPITDSTANTFRVTNYNPDHLATSHNVGMHKYCITKSLFDTDLVLSLPKIKTHQKVGITGAIKNLVGLNGDKDFLPHHRIGGTGMGGDCYPGSNYLRYWSELFMDNANRNQGKKTYRLWQKLSSLFWRLSFPGDVHQMAAGWYGNDTTWRMVLDINKIAVYGTPDGRISLKPQREIYSLCDGVIGGQGNGPLSSEPLPLGIICFSNHSYLVDLCMSSLMGFDLYKIPLLSASESLIDFNKVDLTLDGEHIDFNELGKYSVETLPPPGWKEHLDK